MGGVFAPLRRRAFSRRCGAGVFRADAARGRFFAPRARDGESRLKGAGDMHPPFSFWRPKKRTGRARSKRKNAFAMRERFGF